MESWNGIHSKQWEVLTRSIETGGFGFGELHSFNIALLTKMATRTMEGPTSLWVQTLKGLYFPRGDFFTATKGARASWGWSSILVGREILKSQGIWRIGNGSSIQVFNDLWICTKPRFGTTNIHGDVENSAACVNSLIDPNKQWDKDRVWLVMTCSNAKYILRIPIPIREEPDKLVCPYTKDGLASRFITE